MGLTRVVASKILRFTSLGPTKGTVVCEGVDGGAQRHHLFLVAPDDRETNVRHQALSALVLESSRTQPRYVPYGELCQHREAVTRFGAGIKPAAAIARMC